LQYLQSHEVGEVAARTRQLNEGKAGEECKKKWIRIAKVVMVGIYGGKCFKGRPLSDVL
jgi:hypothetical protein